jgi:Nif-specific regulatory protein
MELFDKRFEILRRIGQGVFGTVYQVRDIREERLLCLKLFAGDFIGNKDDMGREFILLTRLSHPNLIRVFDYGVDDVSGPYYTMEYAPNGDLSKQDILRPDKFKQFFKSICSALDYMHRQGIIHGDIKQQNILIGGDGSFLLSDFGLSTAIAGARKNLPFGSAAYIAPELLQGAEVSASADIFSLGLVCYELISGKSLLGNEPNAIMTRKLAGDYRIDWIGPEYGGQKMTALLNKMIIADPQKRYKSVYEVLADYNMQAAGAESHWQISIAGPSFIGRKSELEWLAGRIGNWSQGQNTVLFITGESGIGKSALLEEFKVRSQVSGFKFYRVFCRENDNRPFSPLLKLLGQIIPEFDPEYRIFSSYGPDLRRLFPAKFPESVSSDLTEADAKSGRRRLLDNLMQYLGELSVRARAIIAVEDLHWADNDTIEFLKIVLANDRLSRERAAFIICTGLVEPDGYLRPIVSEYPDRQLELSGVDVETWKEFVISTLGNETVPAGFADDLLEESGGNFLFALEILNELARIGTLDRMGGNWRVSLDWRQQLNVPSGVQSILIRRFDHLEPEYRPILEIGAILGRSFLPDEIAELGGSDLIGPGYFDELVKRGFLRWIDFAGRRRLDFPHGQLRRCAYMQLSDDRRRDFHHIVAEYSRRRDAGPETVGHHYLLADEYDAAYGYVIESAHNAENIFAYEKASQFYRLGLECLDKRESSGEKSLLLSETYILLGKALDYISPADATRPLETALELTSRETGVPHLLAEVSLALGNNFVHTGAIDRAEEHLKRACEISERLRQERLAGESYLGLGFAYDKMGRLDLSEKSYLKSLDFFSEVDFPEGSCRVLNYLGIIKKRQGDFNGALDCYQRALAISLDKKYFWLAMNLYGNLGNLCLAKADYDRGLEYYTRSLDISREISDRRIESINLLNIGHVCNELGKLTDAEGYLSQALAKFREMGDKGSEAIALNNLGLLHYRQSEIKKSIDDYDSGLRLSTDINQPRSELANLIGLAEVNLAIANYEGVELQALKARDLARSIDDQEQLLVALAILSELYFELGDFRKCETIIREQEALGEILGDTPARARIMLLAEALGLKEYENKANEMTHLPKVESFAAWLSVKTALARDRVANPELLPARLDDAIRKARLNFQPAEAWRLGGLKIACLELCGEKFEKIRMEESLRDEILAALAGLAGDQVENLLKSLNIDRNLEKGGAKIMVKVSREERLEVLIRVTRTINTIRELDPLLNKIMDLALETLEGERGFVMLFSESGRADGRILEPRVARNLAQEDIFSETTISHSSALEVARSGQPLILARTDGGVEARQSVVNFRISSVLCAPLAIKGDVLGIVYVDSRSGKTFTNDDLDFLTSFADLAAIAIENARLAERLYKKNIYLQKQVESIWGFGNIVGRSASMQKVFKMAESVAQTDVTVVITGESGTGKEILARAIHFAGQRKKNNFVPVDCGALAETLLESELFGYVKGAFTGAVSDREGLFEVAEGGAVFLDEINNTSKGFQAKLLRVLQEGEIRRVGDNRIRKVDVRIMAASNKDLEQEVKSGNFREDLYYRLNVVNILLPLLRERLEDIPILANYFLERICAKMKVPLKIFSATALDALLIYDWPGNVRQLENVCERLIIFSKGSVIEMDDLPVEMKTLRASASAGSHAKLIPRTRDELKGEKTRLEKLFLTNLLSQTRGNVMEASRLSGMDRSQIHHLMSRFGVNSADFKKGD